MFACSSLHCSFLNLQLRCTASLDGQTLFLLCFWLIISLKHWVEITCWRQFFLFTTLSQDVNHSHRVSYVYFSLRSILMQLCLYLVHWCISASPRFIYSLSCKEGRTLKSSSCSASNLPVSAHWSVRDSFNRPWSGIVLCEWHIPVSVEQSPSTRCSLMTVKMKLPSLSSLSLIRLLTLSLRHPGREILSLWLLLFPSSEIYLDRNALAEIV